MGITKKAYAKINLTLDVLNKREDGYHNIISVMQSISLCDNVRLLKSDSGIEVQWNAQSAVDEQNTAFRAASFMLDKFCLNSGISIEIDKRIPISAGLGGGSADAAAVIEGINELFSLGLSRLELMSIGANIGADVPFCIHKGAALAEGIGDRIMGFDASMECYVVLVKPCIGVSTREVYSKIDKLALARRPDMRLAANALEAADFKNLGQNLYNVMELVTAEEYPVIKKLKQKMAHKGASGSLMSGSGPTVYGLFANRIQAENAFSYFKEDIENEVFVCEFYYPNP